MTQNKMNEKTMFEIGSTACPGKHPQQADASPDPSDNNKTQEQEQEQKTETGNFRSLVLSGALLWI